MSEKKQNCITYLSDSSDSSQDSSLSSSSSSSSHSSSSNSQDSVPDPEPVQVANDEDYDPSVIETDSPPDSGDGEPARSSGYNLRSKKKTVSFSQANTLKEILNCHSTPEKWIFTATFHNGINDEFNDSSSMKEAMKSEHHIQWKEAISEE